MVAQIIELVDVQTQSGQEVLNISHWLNASGAGVVGDLTDWYHTTIVDAMKAMQHTSLSHTGLRYRKVLPTAELQAEILYDAPVPGTDGNPPAPSFQSLSFKYAPNPATTVVTGGFTGHIKRGGIHIGGTCESAAAGNTVDPGILAAGLTFATDMLAGPNADWELCIVSFLIGNKVKGGPPRPRSKSVTAYCTVNDISAPALSTQNSRKVLRGRTF